MLEGSLGGLGRPELLKLEALNPRSVPLSFSPSESHEALQKSVHGKGTAATKRLLFGSEFRL